MSTPQRSTNIFGRLANIHDRIASDVWPNGLTVSCSQCGAKQHLNVEQAADCLASGGWPKCCGRTMQIEDRK